MLITYLTVALVSYLLGSIPFGYVLVKLFRKQDIRQTGSGNIGATNVARSGAKGLAIATLLLDAGKGALASYLVFRLQMDIVRSSLGESYRCSQLTLENCGYELPIKVVTLTAFAALFAIMGHMFPVWLRFRGGKGVATAVGAFIFVDPRALFYSFVFFVLIVVVTRYVSVGSISAAIAFPVLSHLLRHQQSLLMESLVILSSVLIILKHHGNIRRLLAGKEHKFGKPKLPADPIQAEKNA
jgi:glycerol-3-phosphate acyltransferase PlsY